jgi:hypothetical protein
LSGLNIAGDVSTWDLSGVSWRQRACALANRNLTREEWSQYIGDPNSPTLTYHATCPALPPSVDIHVAPGR